MILHRIMTAVRKMEQMPDDSIAVREAKAELDALISDLAKNEPIKEVNENDEQGNADIQF